MARLVRAVDAGGDLVKIAPDMAQDGVIHELIGPERAAALAGIGQIAF
jgi:hypothetical protein